MQVPRRVRVLVAGPGRYFPLPMGKPLLKEFRRRFWLPPRAHGDIIEDRTVSFLELFYDLVYVVVIGRAAHTLADHVTWGSVGEFATVFGLIWLAWMNGTLYYELHGREDGRTRLYVFIQMLLLALLAVYTAGAAHETAVQFAIVFVLYLLVLSWLWYTVRRQDSPQYMATTARYLTGMIVSIVVMAASVFLEDDARLIAWAGLFIAWMIFAYLSNKSPDADRGMSITDSMVERYGLFVIIVLGEVVVGVVDGLSDVERSFRTVSTGLLGLIIGFAYWWTYFDFVGRRRPVDSPPVRARWLLAHFPVTLSIAAAGAGMVSLVEHAEDASTPAATAWLLAGSIAVGLGALVVTIRTLGDFERLYEVYGPVLRGMLAAVAIVLAWGWWGPAPWLLALLTVVTLMAVWFLAVDRWLSLDDPDIIRPQG